MDFQVVHLNRSKSQGFFRLERKESNQKRETQFMPIKKDNDIDIRIEALQQRLNACDSHFRANTQSINFAEKNRKAQYTQVSNLLKEIALALENVNQKIPSIDSSIEDKIKQKIQDIIQKDEPLVTNSLLAATSKIAVESATFEAAANTVDSELDLILNEQLDSSNLVAHLRMIRDAQNKMIKVAKYISNTPD